LRSAQLALVERLPAMPGVESAALASDAPQNQLHSKIRIQTNDASITADRHSAGSGFFHTVEIRLLSGREFNARDDAAAPKVAIVNRTLAARLWPDGNPLSDLRTADELLSVALAPQRLAAGVFGAFGLMAIVLASVGVYSVMGYTVARRTREIGIRMAMGAKPAMAMRQILGQSMAVAGAGVAAGISISALLARFVAPQVKGVSVYDGTTFATAAALVGMVAFFAAAIPARRAARIDPQVALRAE
jgi:ABC-type antimicrobial peptide transport system permease subunit